MERKSLEDEPENGANADTTFWTEATYAQRWRIPCWSAQRSAWCPISPACSALTLTGAMAAL